VTINLAPADVKKDSAAFDLPIALAAMLAGGQFATEKIDQYLILGELALDGRVRAVKGSLATAMLAQKLRDEQGGKGQQVRGVIVPADNAAEAAVVSGIDVIGVRFLSDAVGFLTEALPIEATVVDLEAIFQVSGKYGTEQLTFASTTAAADVAKMPSPVLSARRESSTVTADRSPAAAFTLMPAPPLPATTLPLIDASAAASIRKPAPALRTTCTRSNTARDCDDSQTPGAATPLLPRTSVSRTRSFKLAAVE
jgi:hypothetical protein